MPARNLDKLLEIKTPCTADWDTMIGNDQIRFCEHCNLSVNDLSHLTPKRVRRLIVKSKGRLCVRYRLRADGSPVIKAIPKPLHQISRRVSRIAAGAFSATLSLSSVAAQTATDNVMRQRMFAYRQVGASLEPLIFGAVIKGRVTDPNGAVIQGAGITLGSAEIAYLSGTLTDAAGEYKFEGLQPGTYRVTIEATGFDKHRIGDIVVADNETQSTESSLEVATIQAEVEINSQNVPLGGAVIVMAAEPLIRAAQDDDLETLQALLTSENVNVRDKNLGTTALDLAVRNGNREMVQLLLTTGAEANSRNGSKETALMMLGGEASADIVWDLINAGAKVDLKDEEGDTALIEAAMERNLQVLTALIHAGAKVDTKNKEGQTALMIAASNDQIAHIRALIRAGADMNARDKDGKTALDYAIAEDNEKVSKLLQSYGAIAGEQAREQ